jgi:glycosyltransferase domain-containing protein
MCKPLVSIGCPIYNRPLLFKKMLDSLLSQTYKNIEIIIGDNSENDESEIIYKDYGNDTRIKYNRHGKNIGAVNNFIFVRDKANGKYFMWTADDDYWENTFIEKAVEKLENHPEAVACWSAIRFFNDDGIVNKPPSAYNQDLSNDTIVDALIKFNMQYAWYEFYCLIRTDVAKKFDYLKQRKINGSDVVFVNYLLLSGKCLMINESLFNCYISSIPRHDPEIDEYARINSWLNLFIRCFQLILHSAKISLSQKMLFYIKYWFNIIFINQLYIDKISNYSNIKSFFKLVIRKRNYGIFVICFPLLIYFLFVKIKKNIKRILLKSFSLFRNKM